MMPTELVTAVQERIKVIVVLVQNHGFHSIGSLSEELGSQRFGTRYRYRGADGRLDGEVLPVDLAANARSLGVHVIEVTSAQRAREGDRRRQAGSGRLRPAGHPRHHGPVGLRPGQPGVVGRPGERGLGPRVDPGRLRPLPRARRRPAAVPGPHRADRAVARRLTREPATMAGCDGPSDGRHRRPRPSRPALPTTPHRRDTTRAGPTPTTSGTSPPPISPSPTCRAGSGC